MQGESFERLHDDYRCLRKPRETVEEETRDDVQVLVR